MSDMKRYDLEVDCETHGSRMAESEDGDYVRFSAHESALSAKDSRIAELDGLCAELYQVLGTYDAPTYVLDKVSAAANGEPIPAIELLPFAPSTPSEDGGEVPVEHQQLSRYGNWDRIEKDVFDLGLIGATPERFRALYAAPVQHSRIVAAKDAEIAQVRETANRLQAQAMARNAKLRAQIMAMNPYEPVAYVLFRDGEVCYEADDNIVISNKPGDYSDLYQWLPVYTAQPARQVGGDEREQFGHWFCEEFKKLAPAAGVAMHLAKEIYWIGWQARAELAPAAVVMPNQLRWLDPKDGGVHRLDIVGEKLVPLIDAYEVARLNPRAIPAVTYQLDGQVIRTADGKYVAELMAYDRDELRALLGKEEGGQ